MVATIGSGPQTDDFALRNFSENSDSTSVSTSEAPMSTAAAAPAKGAPAEPSNASDNATQKERAAVPRWLVVVGMLIGGILLLLLVFWGGAQLGYAYTHESSDDAALNSDSFTVTSKVSGRVDRVLTDTNRFVRRGQLLAILDDREERTSLAQAISARNAAAAQAEQAHQNVLLTQAQVSTETVQSSGGLDTARSNVASAAASFDASALQSKALNAAIAQARGQLDSSIAAVPGARQSVVETGLDLNRDSSLARTGDVDQSTVDADRASYETALSKYREAQASVTAARANVADTIERKRSQKSTADADAAMIQSQQGSVVTAVGKLGEANTPYRVTTQAAALKAALRAVETDEAQVRLAREQLSYTRVYSPTDGAVAQKAIGRGQTIGAGQTLFTLVPSKGIYVTANYKETQLDLMRIGQPVDVHVDAYPEIAFIGHVATFNPATQNQFALIPAQNSSGNFVKVTERVAIRIFVDRGGDALHPLRPGMSVETYVRVR